VVDFTIHVVRVVYRPACGPGGQESSKSGGDIVRIAYAVARISARAGNASQPKRKLHSHASGGVRAGVSGVIRTVAHPRMQIVQIAGAAALLQTGVPHGSLDGIGIACRTSGVLWQTSIALRRCVCVMVDLQEEVVVGRAARAVEGTSAVRSGTIDANCHR